MVNANEAALAQFLASEGLTENAIDGALGNLEVESNYSPTAYNAREGAIGIAQWENGRRTNLDKYAAAHGGQETDLAIQEGYLWQELSGPYAGVLAQLQAATSPAQAAAIFDQGYEGSAGTTRAARVAAANHIAAGGGTATLTGSIITPGGVANAIGSAVGVPGLGTVGSAAAGAVGGAAGAIGSAVSGLFSGWGGIALKLLMVGTGLALVVGGGYKSVVRPAQQTVETHVEAGAEKAAPVAAAAAL